MSPNIQEPESPSRKRNHEEFLGAPCDGSGFLDFGGKMSLNSGIENMPFGQSLTPLPTDIPSNSPLPQSSPGSLTDAGSSTPARHSPSPNLTPSRPPLQSLQPQLQTLSNATAQAQLGMARDAAQGGPPAKRKRLTDAEKEEKAKADAARKQEREEKKAAKDAEKAAAEAEKKKRNEEREQLKKSKEEDLAKRNAEKNKVRQEKEEQARRAQEEKDKKQRSQMRLNSFFTTAGPSTPKKASQFAAITPTKGASPAGTPQKHVPAALSEYEKMFKPFFVKDHVTVARSVSDMDHETKEVKSQILDEFLEGKRQKVDLAPLNSTTSVDYFLLRSAPAPRGRRYPSVRKIMSIVSDVGSIPSTPVDLTTESQNSQIKMTQDLLKTVPMKFIGYKEDVRPAYYGTVTNVSASKDLRKLGRNPIDRTVLPLAYDYDSEAEWVDDGEGDDLDDLDDEEEDVEEDEEMGDFLDDSEDSGPARHAFGSVLEPDSTGLCWEDRKRQGPLPHMYKFRMEFILDLDHHSGIDPFSTQYWETEKPKTKSTGSEQTPSIPTGNDPITTEAPKAMPPPPVPSDAFSVLTSSAATKDGKKATVPPELREDLKQAILKNHKLTKLGLVEILSTEFIKCTKNQIKNSVEQMAERTGKGREATWKLKA